MVLSPKEVVDAGLCIGCGGCARDHGPLAMDSFGLLKPAGTWTETATPALARTCPFSPDARDEDEITAERFAGAAHRHPLIGSFESAYVGHVAEEDFRPQGSSGGMVSWVATELLRRGMVDGVAHVAPTDREQDGRFFGYRISRSVEAVQAGAKSRYYPVELSQVLAEIRAVPGRYAVVGVPCVIKAVQLLRAEEPVLAERIAFTLGLFCGHQKSARLVDSFAWQLGAPVEDVRAVEYRRKDPERPANWYTAHLTLADGSARWQDWWHLADGDWGAGFFQNSACNYCDDVVAETADIAFGDAWVEPYSSDGRGTNVVIVRHPELQRIVATAREAERLALAPIDAAFIADTQAAGFRQRREGLAYRLRFAPPKLKLRKRVAPGGYELPLRRKLVYRTRRWISATSHRLASFAAKTGWHGVYLCWARLSLRVYEGFAYRRGAVGKLFGGGADQ